MFNPGFLLHAAWQFLKDPTAQPIGASVKHPINFLNLKTDVSLLQWDKEKVSSFNFRGEEDTGTGGKTGFDEKERKFGIEPPVYCVPVNVPENGKGRGFAISCDRRRIGADGGMRKNAEASNKKVQHSRYHI